MYTYVFIISYSVCFDIFFSCITHVFIVHSVSHWLLRPLRSNESAVAKSIAFTFAFN